MSGRVGDLSPKQEETLKEFKGQLSDVLEPKHDDHLLLQYLRARCFDLKKSGDMFRKHLQWRKQFSEEYVLTDYKPPEILRKYLVPPFIGFDNQGSPVRLVKVGQMDLKGVTQAVRLRDLEEYVVWILDNDKKNTKKYNEKLGQYVETRTFVFDLEGLSIRQITKPVLELIVALLKLYEANYPENLKVAVVTNIPYFFAWIFNIIKSILNEDTVKKIKIFGKDGYKEELLKIMDPEILPVTYGGTRTDDDGDPDCRSMFGTNGPVPMHDYLKNQRKLSKEDDSVRELSVARRSKKEIVVYANSPGVTILWEVEVPNQDLSFGIFFKKDLSNDEYLEEIVPFTRAGGVYGPVTGSYVTKKAGKYVLIFDNEFSLLRGKTVLYRLNVMPPIVDDMIPISC